MNRGPDMPIRSRRDALRLGGAFGLTVAAAGALASPSAALARQGTPAAAGGISVTKQTISLATANKLIAAAEAKATELGVNMAIAVVDEEGLLKAFSRMDGVSSAATVDLVHMKAYTAASFRTPTDALADQNKDNPPRLASLAATPRFTLLAGGFPIKAGDVVVGGLGIGGGTPDQDVEVGKAALTALG